MSERSNIIILRDKENNFSFEIECVSVTAVATKRHNSFYRNFAHNMYSGAKINVEFINRQNHFNRSKMVDILNI